MCDTLVAVGKATVDGVTLLAKNSDREPNEAHWLVRIPRAHHRAGETVKCTYIEIPQVAETYEVLLAKPFWLWGCEMGANECGVAIGNEAVFTKEPYDAVGLVGMDFIRLGLERGGTAREALDVIADLTSRYGQGGPCGFTDKKMTYHNSYLIADPREAWVLETAGRYWVAEKVHDVRTISNGLTIGKTWDLASPGLVEHAIERGWCRSAEDFDFARAYRTWLYTRFSESTARQQRTTDLLRAHKGQITVETMMAVLRDHGAGSGASGWTPHKGSNKSICAHAADPILRKSQATGSMVARLGADVQTYWVTGTSAPCLSIFKPLYLVGAPWPDLGPEPGGTYDEASLWWTHERLHRAALRNYGAALQIIRPGRDQLEARFLAEERALRDELRGADPRTCADTLGAFAARCWAEAREAMLGWRDKVEALPLRAMQPWLYSFYWRGQNRRAGLGSRR